MKTITLVAVVVSLRCLCEQSPHVATFPEHHGERQGARPALGIVLL